MKVKYVIRELQKLPPNASLEFGRLLAVNQGNELLEVRLDFPIIGVAYHEGHNEVLLVIEHDAQLGTFAVVRRLEEPSEA